MQVCGVSLPRRVFTIIFNQQMNQLNIMKLLTVKNAAQRGVIMFSQLKCDIEKSHRASVGLRRCVVYFQSEIKG